MQAIRSRLGVKRKDERRCLRARHHQRSAENRGRIHKTTDMNRCIEQIHSLRYPAHSSSHRQHRCIRTARLSISAA